MNRSDLRKLSVMRLSDAKTLLQTKRNDAGAFYVAGYAVECAIKACIAKNQKLHQFPPSPEESRNYYTHNLKNLIKAAGLESALETACNADSDLKDNWSLVSTNWSEKLRYETTISPIRAVNMIDAINDPNHGVLTWLKNFW